MNNSVQIYAELLSAVVRFNNFSTIFYFDPEDGKERCHLEGLLSLAGKTIPLLLWSSIKSIKLSSLFNTQLLVMACLSAVYREDFLNTLSITLRYMKQTKLLIELVANQDVDLASRVLQFCLQNHMLNAALIFGDFGQTHTFYSYEAYPNFVLNNQKFTKELLNFYPDKTLDLHGSMIRTMPDLSEPNTILYNDKEGNARVLGYAWNMVEEYARKHNASLRLIDQVLEGKRLTRIQLVDMVRHNVVDIGASIQPLTLQDMDEYRDYTYPVEVASWCTMLPLESVLEVREMYAWMLPGITLGFLSLLWLIYELRKGRWHRHRRLRSIGWKVLALMLACNVQGRLITLFIAPPAKPSISNFNVLSSSRLRIFSLRFEHNLYDFDLRTRYSSAFYLSDKISDLLQLRNSMNTTYAYTVTHTKWQLYAEQQTSRLRPLFYYSENFCLYRFMSFAMIMPENSPHRDNFHHYTLQLGQSGLLQHWEARSFYYMVQAGKLHRQDLSEPRHFNPLALQDLHIILDAYALGILISLTLFIVELLVSRLRVWLAI